MGLKGLSEAIRVECLALVDPLEMLAVGTMMIIIIMNLSMLFSKTAQELDCPSFLLKTLIFSCFWRYVSSSQVISYF